MPPAVPTLTRRPRYAAIDIGSNAVRLLIATAAGGRLKKEMLARMPVRLGGDVFTNGSISPAAQTALLHTLRGYAELIRAAAPQAWRCVATSALREASNREEIITQAAAAGVAVDIISGEEEAQLAGRNKGDGVFADIGGGSTDIVVWQAGEVREAESFQLGTLRGWADCGKEKKRMKKWLKKNGRGCINASGGGINSVAKILGKNNDAGEVKKSGAAALLAEVEKLSPPRRAEKYNLRPDRADTIENLLRIALEILSASGANKLRAQQGGLADGVVYNLYLQDAAQKKKK